MILFFPTQQNVGENVRDSGLWPSRTTFPNHVRTRPNLVLGGEGSQTKKDQKQNWVECGMGLQKN